MTECDGRVVAALAQMNPLFLVWGSPYRGPRSLVLARELGISDLHYVYCTSRQGLLSALFKYPYQAIRTVWLLLRKRPGLVFVQSPPSLAVIVVYLYCRLTGAHYVVDAHSAAFLYAAWRRPEFLYRHLARKALATIVTNEHFQTLIRHLGARAFVLRDIPTVFSTHGQYSLNGRFNIVVVSSFSEDEPLADILTAANQLPQVHFYISGDKQSAPRELFDSAPPNVHFTGFLPNDRYYSLLSAAQAIMSLTTRDNTMQRGACEALSIGKPVIVSDWPLLRDYFSSGAVHVQNTETGILEGVMTLQSQYDRYLSEITQLRASRQREWQEKKLALTRLIETTTL